MRVTVDPRARAGADPNAIEQLRTALAAADFAESCHIGAIHGVAVIVKCPGASRGVEVNTTLLSPEYLHRVIALLAESVVARDHEPGDSTNQDGM